MQFIGNAYNASILVGPDRQPAVQIEVVLHCVEPCYRLRATLEKTQRVRTLRFCTDVEGCLRLAESLREYAEDALAAAKQLEADTASGDREGEP